MTVRDAWRQGVEALRKAEVPTESPDLDARVLLKHLLGTDLTGLLSRYPEPFSDELQAPWLALLGRRAGGEPVAWLVGKQEFMGLDFVVGPGVLVPRADTETLVEAALELLGPVVSAAELAPVRVVDVCTGSGCVALSLAALTPSRLRLQVTATDLSGQALGYAFRNAQRLLPTGPHVEFVATDLLEGLAGPFDLIVSNPPYLTPDETGDRVGAGGWKEPALALDGGGKDGLALIRRLTQQAAGLLGPGGWLLVEAADAQMEAMEGIFRENGLGPLREWKDLAGQRRVLGGQATARRDPLGSPTH
ncbi:MAG: peptide chain release factor N(5)-glutamine methyltransferase [Spirochaetales bacterium]